MNVLRLRELLLTDDEIQAFCASDQNQLNLSYNELRKMALDSRFFAALAILKFMNISPIELLPKKSMR